MKIKAFFSVLVLAFFCMSNFTFANSADIKIDAVNKIEASTNAQVNLDENVVVDFTLDLTREDLVGAPCKVSGSLTLTTETGNSVSITFTITADTCKEAMKAYNEFMGAWAQSQQ